ncbi:MAG: sensor domain-containing diguanylate cyclase [Acidobacteria bacterium]|nr:sensor domain-containing diguanylate cyclase [Acidobacteriota bacterium]
MRLKVGAPVALLMHAADGWRFVAATSSGAGRHDTMRGLVHDTDMWTGLPLNAVGREWMLVVPGGSAEWHARPDLDELMAGMARDLSLSAEEELSARIERARRYAHVLARRLIKTADREHLYQRIVSAAARCVDAQSGALAIYAKEEGALKICATSGYPHAIVEHVRVVPGEGILGRVFATGRPLFAGVEGADVLALPRRPRYRTASCMVMPLKGSSGVLGVVAVADPVGRELFDQHDVRAFELIIPPAVLALDRERLRDELAEVAKVATIDSVTGLANRHYLHSRLQSEMQRSRRLGHPLAVMLVDLDDFKRINDTWGHSEGDRLLRDVSDRLRESVRIFDVCTRYGGEEFAILMPGADQTVATQVADRVRRAVETAYRDRSHAFGITLSAGVAMWRPEDSAETLLDRADFALLAAKAGGKNAVRVADD